MTDQPYWSIFDKVAEKLDRKDIDVEIDRGEPVTPSLVRAAEKMLGEALPQELVAMYRDVGNGITLSWQHPTHDRCFANLQFLPLEELIEEHLQWHQIAVAGNRTYDFRYAKDPALAKATNRAMDHWLKIHNEGNGDAFVIERKTGHILYHQHDWFDGGPGTNGVLMGASLLEFLNNWASVGFQFPSTLWWASVAVGGKVFWKHKQFTRL